MPEDSPSLLRQVVILISFLVIISTVCASSDPNQIQLIRVSTVDIVQPSVKQRQSLPPRYAEERERLLRRLDRKYGKWQDKHPRWKLLEALHGFDHYSEIIGAEIDRFEGLYHHVPKRHKQILESTIQYQTNFNEARRLIAINARTCQEIVQHALNYYEISRDELNDFTAASMPGKENWGLRTSVSQALKHLVRDWSAEGVRERNATFEYIFEKLERYVPPPTNDAQNTTIKPHKVLIPGAGLGGLAHDIAALRSDLEVTTNEYSAFMNVAYRWISLLASPPQIDADKGFTVPQQRTIHPFIETWSHARTRHEPFRAVQIPDLLLPAPSSLDTNASVRPYNPPVLVEGDFTALRQPHSHPSQYSAITTLFFIDTARNLISYLETIHTLLAPEGVWINVGPLLYGSAPWVQLSLDEIIIVGEAMGFEFLDGESEEREVLYNFNQSSLYKNGYMAQYWVARKKAGGGRSQEERLDTGRDKDWKWRLAWWQPW